MIRIRFTPNLQKHIELNALDVTATTLRMALEAVFEHTPKLRSYLLDDQQCLRQHVAIFINGEQCQDRVHLSDTLSDHDELFVAQALSGG